MKNIFIGIVFLFFSATLGLTADIHLFEKGILVIEGTIEPGDFDRFIKAVQDGQGEIYTVYLFTPGGDFEEAMKIGRALRTLEIASMAPMRDEDGRSICGLGGHEPVPIDPANCTCASAGFYIHIGSVHRGGDYLVVHRPYFVKGRFGQLSEAMAKKKFNALQNSARVYMTEMDVPKHIQEDILGIPSDSGLLLDEKTIKTYFWGDLPSRHEWLRNKCSQLTDEETARMHNYMEKLESTGATFYESISKEERDDFLLLQSKEKAEQNCMVEVEDKSRLAAFEKYFGQKLTDNSKHGFSIWETASEYMGKSFDTIVSEGKFKRNRQENGISTLTSEASMTEPTIILFDNINLIGVVDHLNVLTAGGTSQVTCPPKTSPPEWV